jgi:hypothetical protein
MPRATNVFLKYKAVIQLLPLFSKAMSLGNTKLLDKVQTP